MLSLHVIVYGGIIQKTKNKKTLKFAATSWSHKFMTRKKVVDTRTGAERISDERKRQILIEGWDDMHDDEHNGDELALAAVCYAAPGKIYIKEKVMDIDQISFIDPWPFDTTWDKRNHTDAGSIVIASSIKERIRQLEKAGALIAAEIDRLIRKKKHSQRFDD
jgi:hypothetical protein